MKRKLSLEEKQILVYYLTSLWHWGSHRDSLRFKILITEKRIPILTSPSCVVVKTHWFLNVQGVFVLFVCGFFVLNFRPTGTVAGCHFVWRIKVSGYSEPSISTGFSFWNLPHVTNVSNTLLSTLPVGGGWSFLVWHQCPSSAGTDALMLWEGLCSWDVQGNLSAPKATV